MLYVQRYSKTLNKNEHVYSAGKNFTSKINPNVILLVKLKFYQQNKSRSYSAGKTNSALILPVELRFCW